MSKDFKDYLFDMLGRTDRILANTGTITRQQDLESEHWLQDAIIRNLEVIGEAAKNIPESFRSS